MNSNLLSELNPQQREAVLFDKGVLCLLSGPGSGKTRVITTKIAYLIKEKQVSPDRILAVTFTNKAANEMRERIVNILNADAGKTNIYTFHSLCYSVLKQDGHIINIPPNFSILEDHGQRQAIKNILANKEIVADKGIIYNTIETISYLKNNNVDAENMYVTLQKRTDVLRRLKNEDAMEKFMKSLSTSFNNALMFFEKIYIEYETWKSEQHRQDFDDLIISTKKLWTTSSIAIDKWREKFDYILVDEFQDTSLLQYDIIKLLCLQKHNLIVVGDSDQAIYSWRGADPRIITEHLRKDFPTVTTIKLEQNYRSTPDIIHRANQLIRHNKARLSKSIFTTNTSDIQTEFYSSPDSYEEARELVNNIKKLFRRGYQPKDIAIIYRSNHYARFCETLFLRENIPYKIINKIIFYERKFVRDFVDYLRVILLNDQTSFFSIINTPARKIGPETIKRIDKAFDDRNIVQAITDDFTNAEQRFKENGVSNYVVTKIRELADEINVVRLKLQQKRMSEIFKAFLQKIGYFSAIKTEEQLVDADDLYTMFRSIMAKWEANNPPANNAEFLDYFALNTAAQEDLSKDKNYVTCLTAHGAKGLEFNCVFVIGLNESFFPITFNRTDEDIEEERRLAYVAVTRAKERLIVSCVRRSFKDDRPIKPSRFLEEMGIKTNKTTSYFDYLRRRR